MKTYLSGGCLLLALGPSMAGSLDRREHPTMADTPSVVVPVSMQNIEARSPIKLRDALRQPFDDMEDPGSRPYRLSVEERHRMREQLRSQTPSEFFGNKP